MSSEDEPGAIAAIRSELPPHFLSFDEVERLAADVDELRIFPAGAMIGQLGPEVSVLLLVATDAGVAHAVGYDPAQKTWVTIEAWPADEYSQEAFEDVVERWSRETFGEDDVTHSTERLE